MTTAVLAAHGINKNFGAAHILKNLNFELCAGRIIGLCGENGAGKSTLLKILTGVYRPSSGNVVFRGDVVDWRSTNDSIAAGVAIVHQEFSSIGALTVAENVFLGDEPRTKFGLMDRKKMDRATQLQLDALGLELRADVKVDSLSVAEKQMVELAKALRGDAQVLVLDEPSAVLSQKETSQLFSIIKRLRTEGMAIAYVSHRLDEIFELCTDVAVLKDGEIMSQGPVEEFDHDRIVTDMVGRELGDLFPRKALDLSDRQPLLELCGIKTSEHSNPVDLEVRPGEIVGLAGLVGSGRTELLLTCFGSARDFGGSIILNGQTYSQRSPARSLEKGMSMLTESRADDGLFPEKSVAWNFLSTSVGRNHNPWILPSNYAETAGETLIRTNNVSAANSGVPISALSGGNQQKTLIGRLLENDPNILLLDEPTRGVDVGSKAEIYARLRELADDGMAILIVSSELIEVVGLCDRVCVMAHHAVGGTLAGADVTEENVIKIATTNTSQSQGAVHA